ncbi:MAG: hypothetical protein NC319_09730 [Butyricicoccus sp.]|nr:hypothetical protein [Butyricicoccus sp.]
MKKKLILAAALALALGLCACAGAGGNELLAAASPETSALMLYSCADGKSVKQLTMYDTGAEREILDKLAKIKAVPAPDWTAEDVKMPVYGLAIGRNDGGIGSLEAAWSNGYLILADGSAYRFGFDFAALERDYQWEDSEAGLAIGRLPCSRALALGPEGWIAAMLSPAPELAPPEGISMALEGVEGEEIAVKFRNDSGAEWCYGTYWHLEVELGGAWYAVPTETELTFLDIAMLLPAGEEQREQYWLAPYGELPAGRYRIVAEGLAAEFAVEASRVPGE